MLRNEQASSWKKVNELNSTQRKEGMLKESNEINSTEWDKEKCSRTIRFLLKKEMKNLIQ